MFKKHTQHKWELARERERKKEIKEEIMMIIKINKWIERQEVGKKYTKVKQKMCVMRNMCACVCIF